MSLPVGSRDAAGRRSETPVEGSVADDGDRREGWTEEAAMIGRYLDGDRAALDELVERYREPAFWIARGVVADDDIAADAVQEAFVRVLQRHDQYDPTRPFRAWFMQIVRNLTIDFVRRRKPTVEAEVLESVGSRSEPDRVERRELRERIQTVLAALPEKYRELIRMRDIEGYGSDEIAKIIDVDYGTTRWRIHQARKLFRQAWVARFGEEVDG